MTTDEALLENMGLWYGHIWRWEPRDRDEWTPFQEAVVARQLALSQFCLGGPEPIPQEEWEKTLPPCDVDETGPEAEERIWQYLGRGFPERAKAEFGGRLPTTEEYLNL